MPIVFIYRANMINKNMSYNYDRLFKIGLYTDLYLLYTMFLYMSAAFMSYENMDRPVESVLLYISAERVMIGTCEAFFMLFITAPASFLVQEA